MPSAVFASASTSPSGVWIQKPLLEPPDEVRARLRSVTIPEVTISSPPLLPVAGAKGERLVGPVAEPWISAIVCTSGSGGSAVPSPARPTPRKVSIGNPAKTAAGS